MINQISKDWQDHLHVVLVIRQLRKQTDGSGRVRLSSLFGTLTHATFTTTSGHRINEVTVAAVDHWFVGIFSDPFVALLIRNSLEKNDWLRYTDAQWWNFEGKIEGNSLIRRNCSCQLFCRSGAFLCTGIADSNEELHHQNRFRKQKGTLDLFLR